MLQAEEGTMITADQVKAARKLLGWSQMKLAFKVNISQNTIANFENGRRGKSDRKILAIHDTLKGAGIEFPEGEPVRMRKTK